MALQSLLSFCFHLLPKTFLGLQVHLLPLTLDKLRKRERQSVQAIVWDRWVDQDVLPAVQKTKVCADDLTHQDGDHQLPRMMGDTDLLLNVDGGQAVLGEQDDHGVAGLYGLGDLLAELLTGTDVMLSQVDLDPGSCRLGTDTLDPVGVLAAVAEEDSKLGCCGRAHLAIITGGSDECHGCNFVSMDMGHPPGTRSGLRSQPRRSLGMYLQPVHTKWYDKV